MESHAAACGSERPWQEPYVLCRNSPQRTLFVRVRAPLEQLDATVSAALERLSKRLVVERARSLTAPFVAYHELAANHVDVEIGVPVPEHVHGDAEIQVGALPAGRYLVAVQHGTVPALADIDRALDRRWLEQKHEWRHGPLYVCADHDDAVSDGRPAPSLLVGRRIKAGEARGVIGPCWGASLPEDVMARAASAIRPLSTWPQEVSEQPTQPIMARARQAWLERRGSMHVEDVMTKDVRTCSRSQSLQEAATLLWDHDIGALPVVDHERRPIGVITDRDICMAAYTQGRRLAEIGVASAMSQRIFVCRRRDLISAAEQAMAAHQVRRLPVVDEQGLLVGMLSLNDIVLARTKSPLKSAAERVLGDVVQTLSAISQHRRAARSSSAPPPKRAAGTSSRVATGGIP